MEGYSPGAQNRGAYPHTGPNYSYWGDLTQYGLVYDPYLDAYRRDPRAQQAYYESQGWIEPPPQAPKGPSTMQQVGMMAAPTAMGVAGQWLGQQIMPAAKPTAVAYSPQAGGVIMSDGSVNLIGGGTVPAGGGAGGGLLGLGGSGATGGPAGFGAGVGNPGVAGPPAAQSPGLLASAAPYLGLAGAGLGAYGVYDAMRGRDRKSSAIKGGLSGAGMGAGLGMAAPLAGFASLGLGPLGLLALGGGLLGGGLGGAFGRKRTEDVQRERRENLSPALQSLTARDPNDTGVWKDGKYAGQGWSWDKALDLAKEDPWHFIGNFGNFQTFGENWAHTPEEQQREVVSRLIGENLYRSNKGDILISDADRARQIYNEVRGA